MARRLSEGFETVGELAVALDATNEQRAAWRRRALDAETRVAEAAAAMRGHASGPMPCPLATDLTAFLDEPDDGQADARGRAAEAFLHLMELACHCDAMHGYTCVAHTMYFTLQHEMRAMLSTETEGGA